MGSQARLDSCPDPALPAAIREHSLAVTSDQMDANQFLLATPLGTVDLSTGLLRASDPADLPTKVTAVAPTESADCPRFLKFLNEATGGDQELIRFLQQFCGYSLTGSIREQALAFICGPGGNGRESSQTSSAAF